MAGQAFQLRAEFREDFGGASVAVGLEGRTVDIGKLLREGKGVIEVDDPQIADVLATHPALEPAKRGKRKTEPEPVGEAAKPKEAN